MTPDQHAAYIRQLEFKLEKAEHGMGMPRDNDLILRLQLQLQEARAAIAKAEGCCQFHATGGDKTLSCGGDIAKAEGAS